MKPCPHLFGQSCEIYFSSMLSLTASDAEELDGPDRHGNLAMANPSSGPAENSPWIMLICCFYFRRLEGD